MKKEHTHVTYFGAFSGRLHRFADSGGFIEYNAALDYSDAEAFELEAIVVSWEKYPVATRAAAAVELATRALDRWRNK